MPSKEFHDIIEQMKIIHDKKSHDYAVDNDPFSNFKRASIITSWFSSPNDQTFSNIIGIKIARLAELLNSKTPNNESIDDTFIDLANYCVLWAAFYRNEKRIKEITDEVLRTDIRSMLGPNVEIREQGEYSFVVEGVIEELDKKLKDLKQ